MTNPPLKTFKLNVHQSNFSEAEVLLSEKDYPGIKVGDVIEIYCKDGSFSRLLLQIKTFAEEKDYQQKDKSTISIEQSIASAFMLRPYSDVVVNIVQPEQVTLDSVEVYFKDQYLSRSDMWRVKKYLSKSCVYMNKKIEFNGIRCGVFELWSQGDRVASGFVNDDTKVVYRSTSSMVYLFLQMSSEMWDFDINGDLYFEKAVNGFLYDLFEKWKKFNCNHDVTIVLFSRTFYDAKSIDEFPESMRECLQQDYKGRFYEDFYRVAVQNERYDDWSHVLVLLKKLFNRYEHEVVRHHEAQGGRVPAAFNSTSSQGNFLEVLNISLNVFERHYLDRSFDRTGQLSVVISPGVGVFEVDLDLNNITKQRVIDNGIGSDLVCLGEQPLHAVPLFKFNRKHTVPVPQNTPDVYNMPHWINLSFYSSSKQKCFSNFVPRIKMPNIMLGGEKPWTEKLMYNTTNLDYAGINGKSSRTIPSLIDYDEYDAMTFKPACQPSSAVYTCQASRRKATVSIGHLVTREENKIYTSGRRASVAVGPSIYGLETYENPNSDSSSQFGPMSIPRINDCHLKVAGVEALSTSVESKSTRDIKMRLESKDDLIVHGYNVQTTTKPLNSKPKALINPFDPSQVTIKLTSNRRRWTHVFPLGPTGIFMQQHHYQAVPQNTACTLLPTEKCVESLYRKSSFCDIPDLICKKSGVSSQKRSSGIFQSSSDQKVSPKGTSSSYLETSKAKGPLSRATSILTADPHTDKSITWAWGATGEQEWTPAITTGVDWKSLVKPACLPITTDFFPDNMSLQNDFVESEYTLLPEDQCADFLQRKCYRCEEDFRLHNRWSTAEVYQELIFQRLQQGFQIVLYPKPAPNTNVPPLLISGYSDSNNRRIKYVLSIGRIFHSLELDGSLVKVKQYRPRHPYQTVKIHYCYRFRAPDNETYGVSWVDFASEKLENYNWNYLDNYICLRGESDYELKDSLKYWRFRLLLLPSMQTVTRRILDTIASIPPDQLAAHPPISCDQYSALGITDINNFQESFLKFFEIVNKIRRPSTGARRWSRADLVKSLDAHHRRYSFGLSTTVQTARQTENALAFRDRIGSNMENERVRHKSSGRRPSEKPRDDPEASSVLRSLTETAVSKSLSDKTEVSQNMKRFSLSSPLRDIIEGLKTSSFYFIHKQSGLPPYTFVSAEAVFWVLDSVDGIMTETQAVELLQLAVKEHLICHASGDINHPFKFGFYLYFIVDKSNASQQFTDVEMFRREWFEVELSMSHLLMPQIEPVEEESSRLNPKSSGFGFNQRTIDLDCGSKSDRSEWIHVKYSSIYAPEKAFEIILEWMVATSNQIAEIVLGWVRKASSNGLHLVPIPSDPFALPFEGKSDPLRGPIYVSLNLDSILPNTVTPLSSDMLFHFRERILTKFGFLPFQQGSSDSQRQYVHTSGSIFVLIPIWSQEKREEASTPHEEYITRHFSGIKQTEQNSKDMRKAGFLLSWNYMITKRWKTPATGDETFQRQVLKDFRSFCANEDDRLRLFWNEYLAENESYADSSL